MDPDTVTIVIAIIASNLTMLGLMLRQMSRLEDRLNTSVGARFEGLEKRLDRVDGRLDRIEERFGDKFDELSRELSAINGRLSRIEGHLLTPGRFTLHGLPGDPDTDQHTDTPPAATG